MQIHDFARRGDIAGVARELASGVDVDCLEICSNQSALQCVSSMPDASIDMIQFLINEGARVSLPIVQAAVQAGSLDTIKTLLPFMPDLNYTDNGGCDLLTCAAYGRSSPDDSTLIPVLELLIERDVGINAESIYGESALSVTSHRGRFDAVRFLLDHGADPERLGWTDLMYAVALGTVEDVKSRLEQGALLWERDAWYRTPWLLSLQVGDIAKSRLLLAAGAAGNDLVRRLETPMIYAVEGNNVAVLKWLIAEGFDVNVSNNFGMTPLIVAAEWGYADCVQVLLNAGADLGRGEKYNQPIEVTRNAQVLRMLLAAGEDLSRINDDMRRELTKVIPGNIRATQKQYKAGKQPQFGRSNPQRMDNPFWNAMVHSGCNAYTARRTFADTENLGHIVWCYDRFGRTTTLLPDGRIVEIAGEHEDYYDPDFCIYNDVVVFDGKGNFEILCYSERVFPPTDFHSATLVGDYIYIVGSLGYPDQRRPGETPIFRLHCPTFKIERVHSSGEKPGWISRHSAWYEEDTHRICIRGGQVFGLAGDTRGLVENTALYAFNLQDHTWVRLSERTGREI